MTIDDEVAPGPIDRPPGESHTARNISMVVGVFVLGLIAVLAIGGSGDATATSRLLDKRVPAVDTVTMAGDAYDIDNYRGQFVLVNFFATWCGPCLVEHPELVTLEEYGDTTGALEVVSIVFDDDADAVAALFDERGGTWPVIDDPTLAITFQVAQVPESFLIDPSGVVVAHAIGGVEADEIVRAIEGTG